MKSSPTFRITLMSLGLIFAPSATLSLHADTCVAPPSGLVSWWAAEGNAQDNTGTNNGTLLGGIGFTPGKVGQSLNFADADDGVLVPASASLAVQSLTFESWVFPTDTSTPRPIMTFCDATGLAKVTIWRNWSVGGGLSGAVYIAINNNIGTYWR